MRKQLRPFYSPVELARIYDHVYDHTKWEDHVRRVAWTIEKIRMFGAGRVIQRAADLSCGDGAIMRGLDIAYKTYGDAVDASHLQITGPIEITITGVYGIDLFICTETLEHVENPDALIHEIAKRSRFAVFTTPLGEWEEDKNPEHYWGWDDIELREMLHRNGFGIVHDYDILEDFFYTHQYWAVESTI